jgi:ABC-type nickel/cobalt efflux system permease component RcnA
MLALGLLFILGAAAVTAGAIYDGGESVTFELFGQSIGTTISGVFMAGFATMLVFILGVWMLTSGMARGRRKRLTRKETRARQRESVAQIEEERAQLRAENEQLQERLARDSRPAAPAAAAGAGTAAGADTAAAGRHDTGTHETGSHGLGSRADETRVGEPPVGGDGRVVDHQTDLTSHEERAATSSGQRRDEI